MSIYICMGPIGCINPSILTKDLAIPFSLAAAFNLLSAIKVPTDCEHQLGRFRLEFWSNNNVHWLPWRIVDVRDVTNSIHAWVCVARRPRSCVGGVRDAPWHRPRLMSSRLFRPISAETKERGYFRDFFCARVNLEVRAALEETRSGAREGRLPRAGR
jgi:hypothetical protein